jgi:RNA polymerase sigma factor (TIGR02999 family)
MSEVTRILSAIEQGDPGAAEQLLPLVYEELRKLAAQRLAQEKPGQTLQATALVHDAYIRLVDVQQADHWNSRGHFFAAAAEAMRRILVEQARRKRRKNTVAIWTASISRKLLTWPLLWTICWRWTKC